MNVLDSGAGAFVHGLEDEFYQVRMATIDSICELSCGSTQFARMASGLSSEEVLRLTLE